MNTIRLARPKYLLRTDWRTMSETDTDRLNLRQSRQRAHTLKSSAHKRSAETLATLLILTTALLVSAWGIGQIKVGMRHATLSLVPTCEVVCGVNDSLYEIAEAHPVEGLTTSELVLWLIESNGLSNSAPALGQRLTVPATGREKLLDA